MRATPSIPARSERQQQPARPPRPHALRRQRDDRPPAPGRGRWRLARNPGDRLAIACSRLATVPMTRATGTCGGTASPTRPRRRSRRRVPRCAARSPAPRARAARPLRETRRRGGASADSEGSLRSRAARCRSASRRAGRRRAPRTRSAQRNAVEKTVDNPVRIVALDQLLDRRRLGEEIADGDTTCSACARASADGDASRRHRIERR